MAIIVMWSKTKEKISCTVRFEWSVTRARRNSAGKLSMKTDLVTREAAELLIEKHGLTECYRTKDGVIYDTPGQDFKALFPEGLKRKEEREMVERMDRI